MAWVQESNLYSDNDDNDKMIVGVVLVEMGCVLVLFVVVVVVVI